jgi:hypothetical protein
MVLQKSVDLQTPDPLLVPGEIVTSRGSDHPEAASRSSAFTLTARVPGASQR